MVESDVNSNENNSNGNSKIKNTSQNNTASVSSPTQIEQTSLKMWGISDVVSDIFQHFFDSGKLKFSEFDARAIDAFKSLSVRDAEGVAGMFETSDLSHISNKSAHLCTSIRYVRERRKNNVVLSNNDVCKPDEDKMNAIINRTGYPYERTSGQRRYGPSPSITQVPAAVGHEIYIGSIPYSVCEDTLIPMMEKCGTIYDLRMMLDAATGRNKGFCFVTFVEDDAVDKAVKKYNGTELRPGMKIRVNPSIPNLKISISNLPSDKTTNELVDEFSKLFDGVKNADITGEGCCILEFDRHKNASSARRKLVSGRVRPFDESVSVDWFISPEESSEDDIKVLFVRNIDPDMTDDEFSCIFSKYGIVMRINRFDNYLFVHFADRKSAEKALSKMDKKFVGCREIDVSFAKCQKKDRKDKQYNRPTSHYFDSSINFNNNYGMYPISPIIDGSLSQIPYYYYFPVPSEQCWMYDNGIIPVHFYDYYGMPLPYYPMRIPDDTDGTRTIRHNGNQDYSNGGHSNKDQFGTDKKM